MFLFTSSCYSTTVPSPVRSMPDNHHIHLWIPPASPIAFATVISGRAIIFNLLSLFSLHYIQMLGVLELKNQILIFIVRIRVRKSYQLGFIMFILYAIIIRYDMSVHVLVTD